MNRSGSWHDKLLYVCMVWGWGILFGVFAAAPIAYWLIRWFKWWGF